MVPRSCEFEAFHEQLRAEATLLAGGNNDLEQRACVYHHLYQHSRGNHVFPLLAAHGALWARGYFRLGIKVGWLVSWRHAATPNLRRELMTRLEAFADAFRDINRRVCIETYAIYHVTDQVSPASLTERHVPAHLLEQMLRCHAARRAGRLLPASERRSLFEAFFLWEQDHIVGPSVDAAAQAFDWPPMRRLALKPTVRFSYLPRSVSLAFANFADKEERIEKGLQAFEAGAAVGWDRVERAIRRYAVMPDAFLDDPPGFFRGIRASLNLAAE